MDWEGGTGLAPFGAGQSPSRRPPAGEAAGKRAKAAGRGGAKAAGPDGAKAAGQSSAELAFMRGETITGEARSGGRARATMPHRSPRPGPEAAREPDGERSAWARHLGGVRSQGRSRLMALATAAHDMKTPLATMAGYAELLAGGKLGPLEPRQRAALAEISAHCARLQRMVDDCLGYSMLDAGGVHLKVEVADLARCLGELHEIWRASFAKKGVALYLLPPPALAPFAFDYHKLQRAISNLLENALKFTPQGGTVWLSWEPHFWERRNRWDGAVREDRRRAASADGPPPPNAVRICVCDTGPGIDPEFHQEIFEEFVRMAPAEGAAARGGAQSPRGVGLGLAIARRFVVSHGGKIWVESEVHGGAKFCLLLPLRQS